MHSSLKLATVLKYNNSSTTVSPPFFFTILLFITASAFNNSTNNPATTGHNFTNQHKILLPSQSQEFIKFTFN